MSTKSSRKGASKISVLISQHQYGFVQQSVSFSVLFAHFYSIKWYNDFNLIENSCDDKLLHIISDGAKRILEKPTIKKGNHICTAFGRNYDKTWCRLFEFIQGQNLCYGITFFCWLSFLQRTCKFENVKFKIS